MSETPIPLNEFVRTLASDAPLTVVLRHLLVRMQYLVQARRALAILHTNGECTVAAAEGLAPPISEHAELQACTPAVTLAMSLGRIVTTNDAMRDDRFRAIGSHSGMEIRQLGAVPIAIGNRSVGALCFHSDAVQDVSPAAFEPLGDLATAAATVLELHHLRENRAEDAATGGPTPRHFHRRLLEEVDRAVRYGRPLALLALRFGEKPLADAARETRDALGSLAIIARASLEERGLLALLPETDRTSAIQLGQRVASSGASVGLAVIPTDATDVETILMTAQEALNRATTGTIFDFSGPSDAKTPHRVLATREGRALADMLRACFVADIDLQLQLDLAASWIASACGASQAVLATLEEDGRWFMHETHGLKRDDAPAFTTGKTSISIRSGDRLTALLFASPLSSSAQILMEELADEIGAHLQESVRLQHHRDEERGRRDSLKRTIEDLRQKYNFSSIVGESSRILEALEVVVRAAPTDAPVLISGESGTGKELLARAVHANSPRRAGPFVVMNCAAVPPALLESELFGHVKGAFTGALADRKGMFESAHGGTLFLDEVADTTLELQAKLLRALQFGEMQAVGSDTVRRVSVRIVAASNKPLADEVKARRFREDLYYRINAFRIHLPALRERPEDIPRLVEFHVRRIAGEQHRDPPTLEPTAIQALQQYSFPGNVRELENIIIRAFAYSTGGTIGWRDLPDEVLKNNASLTSNPPATATELEETKRQESDRLERAFVTEILRRSGGNVTHAARDAGMNRTSLQKLLAKHHIEADTFKEHP